MSAEFGIGVLDRDFSKEEMVRFRPLAEVIRDATDVKLVQEKLIEVLHAVTKPGTVSHPRCFPWLFHSHSLDVEILGSHSLEAEAERTSRNRPRT